MLTTGAQGNTWAAQTFKTAVEEYFQDWRQHNPLPCRARAGTLTSEQFARYLAHIYFAICHTDRYMARTLDLLTKGSFDPKVIEFFQEKRIEEAGHEVWALEDLESLGHPYQPTMVPTASHSLMAFAGRTIEWHAPYYWVYCFLAEYLTIVAGPEFLHDLETKCHIAPKNYSVLTKHVELDGGHTEENLYIVGDIFPNPDEVARGISILGRFFGFVDMVGRQCCE